MKQLLVERTGINLIDGVLEIDDARVVKHAQVARLENGESVCVGIYDNDYQLIERYEGKIDHVSKKYMKVQKVNKVQKVQKNKSNVTMAVALPNTGAKLDLITTKLTEVGVDHIIRWTADRSQIRQLSDKKISKLYLHIIGASEQSLRTSIPSVARVESLNDILHHASEKVVCMDMNGAALDTLSERSSLRCLIGPEGGWSEDERHLLDLAMVQRIGLGETVLRMETASIVAGWSLCQ